MNAKGWIFIVGIFVVFGAFIFWITAASPIEEAVEKIEGVNNVEELKVVFLDLDADLKRDDDVRQAAKEKIASFKIRKKDYKALLQWFPAKENALNMIIVPDLSKRLKDYPEQSLVDQKLIDTIFGCFLESVRSKKINPSKKEFAHDRLIIDVADPGQAAQTFKTIADGLMLDLNQNRKTATRIWMEGARSGFNQGIAHLYQTALQQTSGTDYWYFLDKKLQDHYQKDDLDVRYQNILVILTDGYLETATQDFTGYALASNNPDAHRITPCLNADLSDWDVFVLEGQERRLGHNQLLKRAWFNWFTDMGADIEPQEFYQTHRDQFSITARFVRKNIFLLD